MASRWDRCVGLRRSETIVLPSFLRRRKFSVSYSFQKVIIRLHQYLPCTPRNASTQQTSVIREKIATSFISLQPDSSRW